MKIRPSFLGMLLATAAYAVSSPSPDGWKTVAPRDEITPQFTYNPKGGPDRQGSFVIESDHREGLFGWWTKTFPVKGGQYYQFRVLRHYTGADPARRVGVVRIIWRDENDRTPKHDKPAFVAGGHSYHPGAIPSAEPELPFDRATDAGGWTELSDVYLVPANATKAIVELEFRWAPRAKVEFASLALTEVPAPKPRIARLATVHYVPRNQNTSDGQVTFNTPEARRRAFEPLIEQAAEQRADLVVLPEVLTHGRGPYADSAEPIPGPSTEYFGALARKHNMYIVPGLLEREGHLIYNVAVLIGPDGQVVGKYRKVCLPRGEITGGITPGRDYPVFDTRFGKVGMMICYDGFFPEVARELTNRGAEVIAWPVMGCNPMLGAARACENHVYLVSSTHTDVKENWMISAVFGHDGNPIAQAKEWGTIAVAEVDLTTPPHWVSLGNMRAEMLRHRPIEPGETSQ